MGWNQLQQRRPSPLLTAIPEGDYAYFVHSFHAPLQDEAVATSDYGGAFAAVVSRGNFHGVQFHPERSAVAGARLLANFLGL
jgi:glutamine amidotransferase